MNLRRRVTIAASCSRRLGEMLLHIVLRGAIDLMTFAARIESRSPISPLHRGLVEMARYIAARLALRVVVRRRSQIGGVIFIVLIFVVWLYSFSFTVIYIFPTPVS